MSEDTIELEPVATLGVSAASGLVCMDDELFVVADDELVLLRYGMDGVERGELRLLPGELPREHATRKRAKPDLEALVELGDGRMLALGSGSETTRMRGVIVAGERVREVELAPLYTELAKRFDRLNVEGAGVLGEHLVLLTRRTGATGRNAMVQLDLAATRTALDAEAPLTAALLVGILEVELGEAGGAPYGFTDATPQGDGLLFTAAAEQTDDPYDDGMCRACAIGRVDARGVVLSRWTVRPTLKLEGIALATDGTVLVVADADDRSVLAPLLRARLPG